MAVPVGSVVFFAYNGEGDIPPVQTAAKRIAFNPSTGVQLSNCAAVVYLGGEPNDQEPFALLDDGRFINSVEAVGNAYDGDANLLSFKDYRDPLAPNVILTGFNVIGTNWVDAYFGSSTYIITEEEPTTYYLAAWKIHPDTQVASLIRLAIDSVNIGASFPLEPLAISGDGILYYIKGDNPLPSLSNYSLYSYDIINEVGPTLITTYIAGTTYPGRLRKLEGFAMRDGSLILIFFDANEIDPPVVRHIDQTDGTTIFEYPITNPRLLFAGLDDSTIWIESIEESALDNIKELQTSDGTEVNSIDIGSPPVLNAYGVYILQTEYEGCPTPPDPTGPGGTYILVPGKRNDTVFRNDGTTFTQKIP